MRSLFKDSAKALDSELILCLSLYFIIREPCGSYLAASAVSVFPSEFSPEGLYPCRLTSVLVSGYVCNRAHGQAVVDGGGERARTVGLLRARQALSHLSYTPEKSLSGGPSKS